MKNLDKSRKYAYLNGLSTPQLENILRADMDSSGDGDIDMLLYIMELIEQREGGKSPENAADTQRAKEEFDRIYHTPEGTGHSLYATEDSDKSETAHVLVDSAHKSVTFAHGFRRIRRIGLIAAITVVVMLGIMVIAQAAGLDVFGAIARWTDGSFSLGTIRYKSAVDVPNDTTATTPPLAPEDETALINSEYTSIQEALDACGITEVAAPTWIPEGYSFDGVDILYDPDGAFWLLSGGYIKENRAVNIEIEHYDDEPHGQIEKNDAPVETFTINGITVYLLENNNNNAAVWATEHYAYYIGCGGDKDNVRKMAISAIAPEMLDADYEYASIQEVLDVYGITEVVAPIWIPERYSFDRAGVLCKPDGSFLILSGGYLNGKHALNIAIERYDDEPRMQIEKTDAPVETFIVNGISVYLLENINSNIATWATEHYSYYIDCIGEKDELRQIAISAIENVK